MIFLSIGTLESSSLMEVHDCFIPDSEQENVVYNCYSGKRFLPVPSQEFRFQAGYSSVKPSRLSSFYISQYPVTKREYARYLKQTHQELPEALKNLNPPGLSSAVLGIDWQEAEDYCQFHGKTLPTEAQWELSRAFAKKLMHFFPAQNWEWIQDSYRHQSSPLLSWKDPVDLNPTGRKTMRSAKEKRGFRRGLPKTQRVQDAGFRCVSRKQAWGSFELTLDYKRRIPSIEETAPKERYFLRIETNPVDAIVFEDMQFHHASAKTPFFHCFEEDAPSLILKAEDFEPKVLHLKLKKDRVLFLEEELRKIPPRYKDDFRRDQTMVLVPRSRIRIGLSEFDRAKIQNEMLSGVNRNTDLKEETIRRYLKPDGPDHYVYVQDFYIDQNEVTMEQYRRYVEETGKKTSRCDMVKSHNHDQQPVVCIDWVQAQEFCQHYGLELPTEIQFEKASKGTVEDGRPVWNRRPKFVRTTKGDHSRYDVYDMKANVMEWTRDWYDPEAYQNHMLINPKPTALYGREKVIRGASYAAHRMDRRLSKRRHKHPEHFSMDLGFRCVQEIRKDPQ